MGPAPRRPGCSRACTELVTVGVAAERRIAAGEEILWDYGEEYWCGERKGRVPEGADCACWD